MPYRSNRYRNSSRYGYRRWNAPSESKLAVVQRNFGGIDEDIKREFFRLSKKDFEAVLAIYGKKYGDGAASYARGAYYRWRSGSTTMSGQTLERLLEVVPYVFPFETKLALYRKLRNAHRPRDNAHLKVTTETDIALVEAAVERIVQRARAVPLPAIVDQRLVWLAQGDGLTARKLVSASEEAEGVTVSQAVRAELTELHRVFASLELNHTMQHVIKLPCGTVTVDFARKTTRRRRWFMSDHDESQQGANLPVKHEEVLPAKPPKDIFEFAMQNLLSPDDSQEIVLAAQREYLRLQTKKAEGEMDTSTAERELREFIDQMREANALQNVSMESNADFKRASGTTRITMKKGRKWWPFG
jgi:hypothetical protein